ncbi:thioredoxin family protein [Flavobacterium terrae]|uniref:AhpC/TSA family protein n=1 Tax=Flavobacterium terrae TaxID=415425 RepID=A0A1M6GCG7_9FLAO|nr:thioredoxin family protein [Flavobacterium terrae]SHJ07645.1 AhpC/TSA family protein [Flavobacterium terrae]
MRTIKMLALALVLGLASAFSINSGGYQVGDVATDFALKNVNDKVVSLKDYKDAKGFVVIFTCNHCPFAKAYEDRIIAIDKKYKDLGYPVIAINPNNPDVQKDDSFELMKKRAKEKGFTFPYLFDEGQKIYPQYGATKTPHVYLLQKTSKGNVVKYIGAIDDNYADESAVKTKYLENAINSLLKDEEIAVKTTKAIGCSIKA